MNKEELRNKVSEIFGNSDDYVFNLFIEKIASLIEGNQALLLNGIGHFQIKKEPLSRIDRKEEGRISEKEILLFLPAGEFDEANIILFEIGEKSKTSPEFSDSVFDLGIKTPNIILDPDGEVQEEESSIVDDSLLNSITEFIGSGEVVEGFQLLGGSQSDVIPFIKDEEIDSGDVITDDLMNIEGDDDLTETGINEELMNDDVDSGTIPELMNDDVDSETTPELMNDDLDSGTIAELMNDNVDNGIIADHGDIDEIKVEDEYDVTYSSVEPEITLEDVNASEPEVLKFDDDIESDTEFEAEIEAKIKAELESKLEIKNRAELEKKVETSNKAELENKIEEKNNPELETEIEAEIGVEFKAENNEIILDETNPFDKLDDYTKDETKEDIIDSEPEIVEDSKNDYPSLTYSEFDSESNKWYKNPILYIATFGLIVALVVVYLFFPLSSLIKDDEANRIEIDDKTSAALIDSVSANDSTSKQITLGQTNDEKLAVSEKQVTKPKVVKPKVTTLTGLYREIANDRSITDLIYFDGERYTVQSSSWKSRSFAEREVSKLKKRGFDAFIYKVFIPSKNDTWHRVRIGYFKTKSEAKEFLRKNKI